MNSLTKKCLKGVKVEIPLGGEPCGSCVGTGEEEVMQSFSGIIIKDVFSIF